MTYREILLQDQDAVQETAVDLKVENAKTNFAARIAKEKATLAKLEEQKYNVATSRSFNPDSIVESAKLVNTQRGLVEELEAVFDEFFPEG